MANDEPGAAPADSAHASNGAAADANGSGFKLQFTSAISKKRGRGGDVSVQPKEEVRRELVTGFEGGRLQSADPAAPIQGGKRVIPRQENTFQIGGPNKHNPNRFLPTPEAAETNGDHFELAAPEQQQEVTYGLVTRARPSEQRNGDAAEPNGQNGTAGLSVASREWELQKYKQDMERLPEEAGLDAYEAMPVDAFGEAMLRGMGWAEGRCVGRNAKGVVKAKEYVPRPAKLGLGATPSEILAKPPKKHIKQARLAHGESREPKKDMVYVDAEGHVKHVKDGDAQLVERQRKGAAVGKAMRVVAGTHAGLLCSVLEIEPKVGDRSQRASVRLQPSNERVSVRLKELGETWESAEAAPEAHANGHGAKHKHHKHKEKKEKKAGKDRGGSRDADRPPAQEEPSPGGEQGGAHAAAPAQQDGREAERPWLAPYILVKIVDKRLRGGRLYLKKAEVVDVPQPTSCSLVVAESNESVAGVQQSQVETVVPKEAGRRLLIVAGKLRGQRARLLSRDSGAASVRLQLTADFSVHELGFDDVSEYVGEAGEEE